MYHLVIILFITLALNVSGEINSSDAVIFNASATATAGDVVYLQGSGFGTSPKVRYSFNSTSWVSLVPLTSSSEAVMVQFPASLSRLPDLVTIQVSSDGYHWSPSISINQAKAYSFDTNQVGPGNSFRTFGRNLFFSRTPTVRLVDIADGSSHFATVNTGASTSYELVSNAPTDIQASHIYSVYISNGYTGDSDSGGESIAAGVLAGRSSGQDYWNLGVPWAADLNYTSNVYNIQDDPRLSLHSNGSGSDGDDFDAINNAVWTASQAGGGIVYLPAGTYNLYFRGGCGITLLSRVAIVGQNASNTFVNYGFGGLPSGGGYAACLGPTQSGVSDITFTNVNQSGNWPQSLIGLGGNEIFIQRTNWNIDTAQWIVLANSTNMTMQNTSIVQGLDPTYNGPLNVMGASNFVLRGNSIQYVAGAIEFDKTTNGVFENNKVIRDARQRPPSWVITHVIVGNFANNFMLLNNTFDVSGGTLAEVNAGETISSESGGGIRYDEFRGTVQAVGSNAIVDYSQNFNYSTNNAVPNLRVGATLAIVSGQGAGQWATVTAVSGDGHTVFVDKPWRISPTYGSGYATFDWGAANWIISGNHLSNNEKGIEFFDASIRDILITGNTMTDNGEILLSPTEQPTGAGLFNLIVNTQILDNTLVDNNRLRPAAISAVPREDYQAGNFGTAFIGLEIRGNSITGSAPNTTISDSSFDDAKALSEGINLYWEWQTLANFDDEGIPSLLGTVVQGNSLTNSSTAFELNSGSYQTVLAGNNTANLGRLKSDVVLPGASHSSVGTVSVSAAAVPSPVSPPSTPAPFVSRDAKVSVFSQANVWTTQDLSGLPPTTITFGNGTYIPVLGDYDGDGIVDCAVFQDGSFFVRPSRDSGIMQSIYVGYPTDLAAPGDYDGDGKTDFAVFRPSTGQFYYSPSSRPGAPDVQVQTTAVASDIYLQGDYDGDGKTDFVYYRPSTATFYQMISTNMGVIQQSTLGQPGDIPVPGDYDGDGVTDLAVYRPSNGTWYYRPSSHPRDVISKSSEGQPGDTPVSGDYDADGKTDFAVWRPSTRTWFVMLSSNPKVTVTLPMTGLSGPTTPLSSTPGASAPNASLTLK